MGAVGVGRLEVNGKAPRFQHAALAQLCYFVLGTGLLTGWNAFLTASDYFNAVFPGRSIDRVFTVTYLPITLCLIGVVARWPSPPLSLSSSKHKLLLLWTGPSRVVVAYCLFTLCCAAVPLIDVGLVQQGSTSAAYGLVLLCVVLVAVGDGIAQPTVYADAALLPDKYTQAVVMGAAGSGVTIGILRLITKGSLPQTLDGLRISAQAYFAASAAITAAALLLYQLVLPRLDVVQYYRAKLYEEQAAAAQLVGCEVDDTGSRADTGAQQQLQQQQQQSPDGYELDCGSTLPRDIDSSSCLNISVGTSQHCQDEKENSVHAASQHQPQQQESELSNPLLLLPLPPDTSQHQQHEPQQDTFSTSAAAGLQQHQQLPRLQQQKEQHHNCTWMRWPGRLHQRQQQHPSQVADDSLHVGGNKALTLGNLSWWIILQLNWRLCVAGFMTYCVTLSIFPGFLAENVHSAALKDWYPVLLIFTFNVFDFLGRCIPEFGWQPRHSTILLLSLSRLVLIPLYAGLAVYGASEAAFFVLTFALGLTNGRLTTLIFCAAPRGLPPSAAELAGMVNVFAEMAGLNAGAYLGWLWTIGKAA